VGPAEAQPPGKPSARTAESPLQAGFGAGSRHFKKAVDRNRIKRLSREAYRLQKKPLLQQLEAKRLSLAVFFIYTGKELPDYGTVSDKIGVALQKLIREIK
jgi:ribonuclease P protein component